MPLNPSTKQHEHLIPSVMKSGGAYNDASEHQRAGGELAFDLLRTAAARVPLPPGDTPAVVADFGSSQGANSLAPMRIAIDALRARRSSDQPIVCVHVDQPTNDFASLFELLEHAPDSYLGVDGVHAYSAGRSFYERVFPDASVTLAWSAFAVHWMSAAPVELPDQLWASEAPRDLRACFADQARSDWACFLGHRARELAPGGRLVVLAPGSPNRQTPWAPAEMLDLALNALDEAVDEGLISHDELAAMVFPTYFRTPSEWLSALRSGPLSRTLEIEALEIVDVPDVFHARAIETGDPDAFASGWTGWFQTAGIPTLARALHARTPDELERFERGLCDRMHAGLLRIAGAGPLSHHVARLTIARRQTSA